MRDEFKVNHAEDGPCDVWTLSGRACIPVQSLIVTSIDPGECARRLAVPASTLERTLFVDPREGGRYSLPPLLYAALQHGRLHGKTTVAVRANSPSPSERSSIEIMKLEPIAGTDILAQTLEAAADACFDHAHSDFRSFIQRSFEDEIVEHVNRWASEFFFGPWATAVAERRLTREQYVQTLYNVHQYVRFTTRLLGRAVAISPTTELRQHFADHLSGEINHELIIERDLANMNVSAQWLLERRVANAATRAFMVTQQSMVAFEQNPVLFMACPLAAEGITAHLDQSFIENLRACAARMGYLNPHRVTQFFSSHMRTDGGEDGHWQRTVDVLAKLITTDAEQQEFLSVLRLAMDGIEGSFNSNVTELSLFDIGRTE